PASGGAGTVVNHGTIAVTASPGKGARGVEITGYGTVINTGAILATTSGSNAAGIYVEYGANISNSGLIKVIADGTGGGAAGIVVSTNIGRVTTVTNSGTVLAQGTGGTFYRNGIYVKGGIIANLSGGVVTATGIALFAYNGGGAT